MKTLKIANIPGDGVGKEVVPEAVRVLHTIAELHGGLKFEFTEFPWSCDYYLKYGQMMPEDGLQQLQDFDGIFLGAVGNLNLVPDHVSLWGLLIKIRREFQQVINIPLHYFHEQQLNQSLLGSLVEMRCLLASWPDEY